MGAAFGYVFILSSIHQDDKQKIQMWITKTNEDFKFDFNRELEKHCNTYFAFSGKHLTDDELNSIISTLRKIEIEQKNNEIIYYEEDSFSLIYHKDFNLSNTSYYAQCLSKLIPNRILYISGFTGEGFAMGIYKQGIQRVCHQIGNRDCLECHDLIPVRGNIETIINSLPMFDPILLEEFIKKRNAFYAQELFTKAMPITYRNAIYKIHTVSGNDHQS